MGHQEARSALWSLANISPILPCSPPMRRLRCLLPPAMPPASRALARPYWCSSFLRLPHLQAVHSRQHPSPTTTRYYTVPIECTKRDAPYVLDGLHYHESDLDPEEQYTDTHGCVELNFVAFPMFGKRFCPRIRGACIGSGSTGSTRRKITARLPRSSVANNGAFI